METKSGQERRGAAREEQSRERRFFLNKMLDRNPRNSIAMPFGSKKQRKSGHPIFTAKRLSLIENGLPW